MSYAGIALVVSNQIGASAEGRLFLFGVLLVFASALLLRGLPRRRQPGGQARRLDALHRLLAWRSRRCPRVVQFLALEPAGRRSTCRPRSGGYAIMLATFSTVLPLFLQAEALQAHRRHQFALIGAVGPVSVALTSALGLDEPFTWVQALGGALVIGGVLLVII